VIDTTLIRRLGRELKAAREAKGLTQQQVAEAIGVSQSAIGNWEQGLREPSVKAQIALRNLLGNRALYTGEAAA
jgi:transcriptional regulator with XRE-family HTH domain